MMPEKPRKSATQIDEELVAFTDHVLSDQFIEENGMEELDALEATVFQLKGVVKDSASEDTIQRIEKQLINEWNKNRDLVNKKDSQWQKFLPGSRPRNTQARPALAFAFVLFVIFLIGIFPVNQFISSNIQATAGSTDQYRTILLILAALLVIGLFWVGRKKP